MNNKTRTKIIATMGPAIDDAQTLAGVIKSGVDLLRLNFSHANKSQHLRWAQMIREVSAKIDHDVSILADLQGPKIRIAQFVMGSITLNAGDTFCLDAALEVTQGNQHEVGIDYKELVQDVNPGDKLLLDDGRITLQVNAIIGSRIQTTVIEGGLLANNKGINRDGGGLSAPALTAKDREDIKIAAQIGADYLAISFVRGPEDIIEVRKLLDECRSTAGVIAKIERVEALEHLDEIIIASDGVMVARGDLGVELGDAKLAGVQKNIIRRTRDLDKAVITATQMMESMVEHNTPTRAEVFDVANAVLDGTDAVMLSAESAVGNYPEKAVQAMDRICFGAEQEPIAQVSGHRLECQFAEIDESIAMAAMYVANHLDVAAIIAYTESGATPLWMSRIRTAIPIYGLCRHIAVRRRMMLFRGVYPIDFDVTSVPYKELNKAAVGELITRGIISASDTVIITKGDILGVLGGANTMKIIRVGAILE